MTVRPCSDATFFKTFIQQHSPLDLAPTFQCSKLQWRRVCEVVMGVAARTGGTWPGRRAGTGGEPGADEMRIMRSPDGGCLTIWKTGTFPWDMALAAA
jgi:hypothetical protein